MKPWASMSFEERVAALGIKPGSLLWGGNVDKFREVLEIDTKVKIVRLSEGQMYSLNVGMRSYYKALNTSLEKRLYGVSN